MGQEKQVASANPIGRVKQAAETGIRRAEDDVRKIVDKAKDVARQAVDKAKGGV